MKQKDLQDSAKRAALGKLSGLVGIVCNVGLAGSKLAVGKLAGSMSITADGLNNLSDAASSIVTLTGFKLAEKPADKEHPYGHARFEYLASLTVSVMILFIGFELAKSSVEKALHPVAVEFSLLSMLVLIASILVKAGMILVSVFILWSGIGLARDTISPLLGEGVKSDFRKELTEEIMTYPMVLGCHDLMVHDYGPGKRYASIHVEFDKDDNLMACHEVVDQIERKCLEEYGTNLVIHLDPVITDDVEINRMQKLVKQWLVQKDSRLAMHDFRIHSCDDKIKVVFDLMIPDELQGKEEEIKESLENFLNQGEGEEYQADITFDPEADW